MATMRAGRTVAGVVSSDARYIGVQNTAVLPVTI